MRPMTENRPASTAADAAEHAIARSLQFGVLRFGLLENRDVGVRVLPEHEKSLVGSFRLRLIPRQSERSTELQVRQCADGIRAHDTAMIENFLKLGRCLGIVALGQ